MKIKKQIILLAALYFTSSLGSMAADTKVEWFKTGVARSQVQLKSMVRNVEAQKSDSLLFPRTIEEGNVIRFVDAYDWTSGFFPGSLWYAYKLTGDQSLAKAARTSTEKLKGLQYYKGIHDVGFMIYCSYGNGYQFAKQKGDSAVIVNTAKSLSTRFSPKVGLIKSWDHEAEWKYPVIIDNMMNLELLFEATKMTGRKSFQKIAVTHADNTMKNHFRSDMSTYHVIGYDPETGKVLTKGTHQGYSDASAWARGQAWGLYGYTVCYRYTHDKKYLDWADKIAAYIMKSVTTKDLIPYWDYNAPNIPNEPRDASAAAVTASALLELSHYSAQGKSYAKYAETILKSLSSEAYLAPAGQNKNFVLMHSTGSFPHHSEVDVPLNYADYYYLEAMYRYSNLKK